MKIKLVVIDLELSPRGRRRLVWSAALVGVLLVGGAVAYSSVPVTWTSGQALTAADLNSNFSTMAAQIADLQAKVHPASGVHAWLTKATTIPNAETYTQVVFDHVEFDLGSEYSAVTGAFTAKQAGVYLIVCAFEYAPSVAGAGYGAAVFQNGARRELTEISASWTGGATPEHTMVTQLAANDVITCETYQYSGAAASLYSTGDVTQMVVARLY
jgi:hypothetical protein